MSKSLHIPPRAYLSPRLPSENAAPTFHVAQARNTGHIGFTFFPPHVSSVNKYWHLYLQNLYPDIPLSSFPMAVAPSHPDFTLDSPQSFLMLLLSCPPWILLTVACRTFFKQTPCHAALLINITYSLLQALCGPV